MTLYDVLERPFGRPAGLLGRVAARLMLKTNGPLADWALELLALQPPDRVLEIGFGPGDLVRRMAERVTHGRVAGIDVSPLMLEQATSRNAEAIAAGRVELSTACVSRPPFPDASFDAVVSVNSIQFWPDRTEGMCRVRRVLRPGGRAVVVLLDRRASTPVAVEARRDELLAATAEAGLAVLFVAIRPMKPVPAIAIVATRQAT